MSQEMNEDDETCRFLQIWISPASKGHTPQYGSTPYRKEDRWLTIWDTMHDNWALPPQ